MIKKNFIIFSIILVTGAVSISMLNFDSYNWQEEDRSGEIKFSHKFHLEQGIECTDCHTGAANSQLSSDKLFGDHSSCQSCHEEQLNENCEFCHQKAGEYKAFKNPKRELIFPHKKHVELSNVDCETCHKNLRDVDYGSSKNLPTMTTCNECHDNSKASSQCEICHTNFTSLIPDNHRNVLFAQDHKNLVRVGLMDVNCSSCHEEIFCQQCHDGASLRQFGEKGLMSDPMPRSTRRTSPKLLTLQMVHDMNYRFTHSIDAKAKSKDCYSCHEKESFCSSCHMAGGNVTQSKFKPKSHDNIGFTTYGVGSGGGLHAEYSRRDIESCMACHDVVGADATCVKCHFDHDGIKGTNPKTHSPGYLRGEKGIWHDTDGATCYICHTHPNARVSGNPKGGFCNYCHI